MSPTQFTEDEQELIAIVKAIAIIIFAAAGLVAAVLGVVVWWVLS
jgi:hypothetical protein